MINPNDPAFPCQSDLHGRQHKGLSIREELAARAMQSILSIDPFTWDSFAGPSEVARESIRYADALIEELNKPKQ